MKIKRFYNQKRCEKMANFESILFTEKRHTVLSRAIRHFCDLIVSGVNGSDVLLQIHDFLKTEYEQLAFALPWEASVYTEDDTKKFRRLLVRISGLKAVKANVESSYEVSGTLGDGSNFLEGLVHLIMQDEKEQLHALIIHGGTCGDRSMRGKSVHTLASHDLHCLVAKAFLEKEYSGILIHSVYLTHKKDRPGDLLRDWEVSLTATSNMHSPDYSPCYGEDGLLDYAVMAEWIDAAMEVMTQNCYGCSYESLCNLSPLPVSKTKQPVVQTAERVYRIPQYTEDQLEVVRHKDGPMLVCAGPGSGKTAAIIGRIRYLVTECGVSPHFILVVTFTNKAVQELKERCLSFLDESCLPNIATLNSFAYGILRSNEDLLGGHLRLLTDSMQLELVKNIISVMPPLTGFNSNKKNGKEGLYKTVQRKLNNFLSMTPEAFYEKNPALGKDFEDFVSMYTEIIECGNFISFDEQISIANDLLDKYPEVLDAYRKIYKYVMVDEFQDVNEQQAKMVYNIAEHGNIVVVGDDDQNIYSFRGASVEYMRQFPNRFPGARTVVFKDNFRSTESLVGAAQALISNNSSRISKDIRSGSGKQGAEPVVLRSNSAKSVEELIESLVSSGYRYEDIAVLSFKNSTLEGLHKELSMPSVLAKSFMRNDGLFLFAHSVLKLYYSQMVDDESFYKYIALFGKQHLLSRMHGYGLYDSLLKCHGVSDVRQREAVYSENVILSGELSLLQDLFILLDASPSIETFLDMCAFRIDWCASDAKEVLLEQFDRQGINTLEDAFKYMDSLVVFEDGLRVEVNGAGKVMLITCHDAKGKEFPVVILDNDFSSKDESSRRLFYVAVTRAKEQLFILQDASCEVDFLMEIPYREHGTNEAS